MYINILRQSHIQPAGGICPSLPAHIRQKDTQDTLLRYYSGHHMTHLIFTHCYRLSNTYDSTGARLFYIRNGEDYALVKYGSTGDEIRLIDITTNMIRQIGNVLKL